MSVSYLVAFEILLLPVAVASADVAFEFVGAPSAHELGDPSNAVIFYEVDEDGVVGASGLSWDVRFSTHDGTGSLASEAAIHITAPSGEEFDLFGESDFGFPAEEGTFSSSGSNDLLQGVSVRGEWRLEFYELLDSNLNSSDGIWEAGRLDLFVVPAPGPLALVAAAFAFRRRSRFDTHGTTDRIRRVNL